MPNADELYKQAIQDQRDYLLKLQEAFDKRCDEITAITNQRLTGISEIDIENRKKIFDEQKQQLDEALSQLRQEVNRSSSETRKKLENLYEQREVSVLNSLENDIKNL